MKLIFKIMCFMFFIIYKGQAQVSTLNNAPDKSAALDVRMPNKGLLIPRVSLQNIEDKTSITGGNPAEGLWLYNTNAALTNGVGYYYWDKVSWKKMADITEAKDNLGNHIAQQNLKMGSNYISNDGGVGKGLSINAAGDAVFMQQLAIKDVPVGESSDMILKSDLDGLLKKQTMTSASTTAAAFFKYDLSASTTYNSGSKIKFDNKVIDKSNLVANTVSNTGDYTVFTAPKTGYYFIEYNIMQQYSSEIYTGSGRIMIGYVQIMKEPNTILAQADNSYYTNNPSTYLTQTSGIILQLTAGDKISLQFSNNFGTNFGRSSNTTIIGGDPNGNQGASFFSGYFISE